MVLEASIGRYRLDQLVKRGGSSEVWRAYDEALGRPVALKLLYNEVGKTVDRERFAREARAAARLSHPHIVATYDVGEWDDRPYLVMEYLDGRTVVDDLTEQGRLPVGTARSIGAQVADGLAYVHASGVIHRDIKPDNLVWAEDGVLKLVDFGVAWLIDETGPRLTPNGMAMGTFAYLAPETAKGELFDHRSDLYSLGCVLYELLCGVPPFVGPMPTVVLAHVQSEPIPPSAIRADIPPGLERLILDLLAKEPEDRPADAGTVRGRLLDPTGDVPGRLPSPRRPHLRPGRKRCALAVAAGLAAAGAAGSVAWWVLPRADDGGAVAEVKPHPVVTSTDPGSSEPDGRSSTEVDGRVSEERGERRTGPADSTDPDRQTDGQNTTGRPGLAPAVVDGDQATTGVAGVDGMDQETQDGTDETSPDETRPDGTNESGTGTEGSDPAGPSGSDGSDDSAGDEPDETGSADNGGEETTGVPLVAEEASDGAATRGKDNGKGKTGG